ncbi:MAG: hypothetical protein K0Q57_396 [Gammaproteobacteria bacterium]|jgi:predicted negative regulator of RcsB-dependent stress response|nr:hypothetical protein [Gammaproteobacteria bacterium]
MSAHLNDQELIDSLGKWWKKYGNLIVVAVLSAAVAIAVWRFWENAQTNKLNNASAYYQMLLNDVAQNQTANAISQANYIVENFSGTGYASMSELILAQIYVSQNNLNMAQQQLQAVLKQNSSGTFHDIASLRLARICLELNQPQAALNLLTDIPKGYEVSFNLLRGDAYAQMQQYTQANASYQAAMTAADPSDKPVQDMIHMRISSIPAPN